MALPDAAQPLEPLCPVASVAVMATAVLVSLRASIDLVGRAWLRAMTWVGQAEILTQVMDREPGHWLIALAAVFSSRDRRISATHRLMGFHLHVTLGGLRSVAAGVWVTLDDRCSDGPDFRLMGGAAGRNRFWPVDRRLVACVAVIFILLIGRAQRPRFKFPLARSGRFSRGLTCATILAAVAVANASWPIFIVRQIPAWPEVPRRRFICTARQSGVIAIVWASLCFCHHAPRFGRYVFAIGGILKRSEWRLNTRWLR